MYQRDGWYLFQENQKKNLNSKSNVRLNMIFKKRRIHLLFSNSFNSIFLQAVGSSETSKAQTVIIKANTLSVTSGSGIAWSNITSLSLEPRQTRACSVANCRSISSYTSTSVFTNTRNAAESHPSCTCWPTKTWRASAADCVSGWIKQASAAILTKVG